MTTPGLTLSIGNGIAELLLDRPAKRNSINRAMWRGIPAVLRQIEGEPDVRVVLVRGAGGNFAAGADIAEFDTVFADAASTTGYLDDMVAATAAIAALPMPIVAMIEGLCIGAGVAVALACDMRCAADNARFAITPAKLGLVYSLTDTARLVAAVGPSRARDLLFTGRTIDAGAAYDMGLVDEVVGGEGFEGEVRARAEALLAMSGRSIAAAKQILGLLEAGQVAEDARSRQIFADAPRSIDFVEGHTAFKARRPPRFENR